MNEDLNTDTPTLTFKLSQTSVTRGSTVSLTVEVANETGGFVHIQSITIRLPLGSQTKDLIQSFDQLISANTIDQANTWSLTSSHDNMSALILVLPLQASYALGTDEILGIHLQLEVNPKAVDVSIEVTENLLGDDNQSVSHRRSLHITGNDPVFDVKNFVCTPAFALYGQLLELSFEAFGIIDPEKCFKIEYVDKNSNISSIKNLKHFEGRYSTVLYSSDLKNDLGESHKFILYNASAPDKQTEASVTFYRPIKITSCPESLAFGSLLKLEWVVELEDNSVVVNSFDLSWNDGHPQPIQPVLAGDTYSLEIRVPSHIGIGTFKLQLLAQFQTQAGEILDSRSQMTVSYQYLTIPSKVASIGRNENGWQITTRDISSTGYREAIDAAIAITMIQIPSGTFLMGSPKTEEGSQDAERPQHSVTLPSFFLGQTPVTQAQWTVVTGWPKVEKDLRSKPSYFNGADLPVESVSWEDAMEFCKRLSQQTGRHYTLPSEAQWEYACRAGSSTPFAFGDTITPELANYDGNSTYVDGPKGLYRKQTTPVGTFPANDWGLHDMHGNVWEWCLGDWHDNYEGAPADGRPWYSGAGDLRLLRGGSWYGSPWHCRSADRIHVVPENAYGVIGFRVVCLPQGPSLNS